MVPQVNTAEEAARAVQYTFYPPLGQRGIAPYWPLVAGEKYRWGYRFLTVGSPLSYGLGVVSQHVKTLRANPRGEPSA